jgi:hypothetical protein
MKCASAVCIAVLACGGGKSPAARDTHAVVQAPVQSADTATVQQSAESGAVEVYPAAELSRMTAELAQHGGSGRTFGGHATFHYVESRRVASGRPEIHDDWSDVTLVQAGRATLLTGGHVRGGALESGGRGSIAVARSSVERRARLPPAI